MRDEIISEGEKWTILDLLDGATVATFDSWSHFDPEYRAREMFRAYPRHARLFRERVVKYEREMVDAKDGAA